MLPRRDLVLVGVQLLLFAALAFAPSGWLVIPSILRIFAWIVCGAAAVFGGVAVLQLGSSLTPWPSPRAGSQLVTSGTYRWARHPIYAALLVFSVALSIATASPLRLLVAICLYVLFQRKTAYEESMLRERYPAYEAYAKQTPRFGV